MQRDDVRTAKVDGDKRPNLPGLLGALKVRHARERNEMRARQRLETRALRKAVGGSRLWVAP